MAGAVEYHEIEEDDWAYSSIDGVDSAKLKNLIRCVRYPEDLNIIGTMLSELLGSSTAPGSDAKSISTYALVRAEVYCRLLRVALNLSPNDIKQEKYRWDPDTEYHRVRKRKIPEIYVRMHAQELGVSRYLLKKLEEDDDLMTIIFCDPSHFVDLHEVPFFNGCTTSLVRRIFQLWLSDPFLLERIYFFPFILEPILRKVKLASSETDREFIEAKLMLWRHLNERGLKAGARLIWLLARQRTDGVNDMVGELVQSVFYHYYHFDLCFKFGFQVSENVFEMQDTIQDGRGRPVVVGFRAPITDDALLCWAARRNYVDLIWAVMRRYGCKEKWKSDEAFRHYGVYEWSVVVEVWKVALWCGVRHGHKRVIDELLTLGTDGMDLNSYRVGFVSPIHLVALQGDNCMLEYLCNHSTVLKFGADKQDFYGMTPLDYAMQHEVTFNFNLIFYSPTESSWEEIIRRRLIMLRLLNLPGVRKRLDELYTMYMNQANTVLISAALIASVAFVGWMQPPLSYIDYFQFPELSPPAPAGTYQSYIAMEGHPAIQAFVVFNGLSFFLALATMFVGAEATLFVHDQDERSASMVLMRKSIKWMIGFFITSMVCIMGAFICAGLAILPPIQKLEWNMTVPLVVGGGISILPLSWILWSLLRLRKRASIFFQRRIHKKYIAMKIKGGVNEASTFPSTLIRNESLETLENEWKVAESSMVAAEAIPQGEETNLEHEGKT